MKRIFFILTTLFGIFFCVNIIAGNKTSQTEYSETYICTATGWDSYDGKSVTLKIYLIRYGDGGHYRAKEVDSDGSVSEISSGIVKLVTNPDYKQYKYYVKTGFIGAVFFNTPPNRRLDTRFLEE